MVDTWRSSLLVVARRGCTSCRHSAARRREGLRPFVSPCYRAERLVVRFGTGEYAILEDAFSSSLDTTRWIPLGIPRPSVASRGGVMALYPRADFEWESGVLSRRLVDVRENLSIEATIHARFADPSTAVSSLPLAPP